MKPLILLSVLTLFLYGVLLHEVLTGSYDTVKIKYVRQSELRVVDEYHEPFRIEHQRDLL